MTFHLDPEPQNLCGSFSRDYPPALRIQPGDTVVFRTLDAGWGFADPSVVDGWPRRTVEVQREDGHALCGPVYIEGATPEKTLVVRIHKIVPGPIGFALASTHFPPTLVGKLGLPDAPDAELQFALDAERGFGTDTYGRQVALRPFCGVMGNTPAAPGIHPTPPPRRCGGNLDCKELVVGTTLYLPIEVDGALFLTGDGHAAQGDGEVSMIAIECPMDHVELTFDLVDAVLDSPYAESNEAWICLGLGDTLDEANAMALRGMLTPLAAALGKGRIDALAVASLTVDMRVTQVVNGVQGVHAVLPKTRLRQLGVEDGSLLRYL